MAVGVGGFVALQAVEAAHAGIAGQRALLAADTQLRERQFDLARAGLGRSAANFRRARAKVAGLGLLGVVPVVGDQVRGVKAMAGAGEILALGGTRIADASELVAGTQARERPTADPLSDLRRTEEALAAGGATVDAAVARVAPLRGTRLIGPLGRAYRELVRRLPTIKERTTSLHDGLGAFIAFAGGSGPRRYLIFSQNPDELRPTGGFIGTYGLLAADGGRLRLERYDSIESWAAPRPTVAVPPAAAATAFKLLRPPASQSLANVNATPDWPTAAQLAMQLWRQGGEAPVDGVISVTPEFLARILGVLGPVELRSYGEVVTAANVLDRLDYYAHGAPPGQSEAERKRFIAVLAPAVLDRLLSAPSSQWEPLATVIGQSFDARETIAWVTDDLVSAALAARGWDGALPRATGDFFYDGELEYAAKNGRGLQRVFDHEVTLRDDGSARVRTTVTITNTQVPDAHNNIDSASYITVYGPQGATLAPDSDTPTAAEAAISGHPAFGWLRAAPPFGSTSFTVVWDVPELLLRWAGNAMEYDLWWMHVPAHTGDVLRLHVEPPPGWRWADVPPPPTSELDRDLRGSWLLTTT